MSSGLFKLKYLLNLEITIMKNHYYVVNKYSYSLKLFEEQKEKQSLEIEVPSIDFIRQLILFHSLVIYWLSTIYFDLNKNINYLIMVHRFFSLTFHIIVLFFKLFIYNFSYCFHLLIIISLRNKYNYVICFSKK